MTRMLERFTRTCLEVPDELVDEYLEMGLSIIGEALSREPKTASVEEMDEEPVEDERPDDSWTIAEIRTWAREHGVDLPAGGRKSALLAAIE